MSLDSNGQEGSGAVDVRALDGQATVHLSAGEEWCVVGDTVVSGNAFLDGEYCPTTVLAERVAATDSRAALRRLLDGANGFFALVHPIDGTLYLAVDHVRSWPLYYATTDGVYVGDSAEWVHEVGGRRGYDPVAATEYLFTCYVTGEDTLSRDVKQVQAGEFVALTPGEPTARREQYFAYDPVDSSNPVDEEEFREVVLGTVQRLTEHADGRPILLGLTGGYDSRLIALALHHLGYDRTVTYTIRNPTTSDSEIAAARAIADDLDFEHHVLSPGPADYPLLEGSPQMDVVDAVGYLAEYPHVHHAVIARHLREAGVVPTETVHVLGHHVMGGSNFLPDWVGGQQTTSREEFLELLWSVHYRNWEEASGTRLGELLEGRIMRRFDHYRASDVEATPTAIGAFEWWYWHERLPKYLIGRREYTHLGFDMWYPLLDRQLYAFLQSSDHRDRLGKRILRRYVDELDEQIRGVEPPASETGGEPARNRSLSGVAREGAIELVQTLPEPVTRAIRNRYNEYRSQEAYDRDPRHGIVTRETFDAIAFPKVYTESLYRTLLILRLYERGAFDLPGETEFDRALSRVTD